MSKNQSRLSQYLKHRAARKIVAKVGAAKLAAVGAIGVVVLLLALAGLAAIAGATSEQSSALSGASCTTTPGKKSPPARFVPIYSEAAEKFHLGPRGPGILAAINYVESDFGRSTLPGVHSGSNFAGAAGPMQFLYPSSWEMFGVDGDGDHVKDVYNPADAIFSAANLLKASGAPKDWYGAVFSYNHADWYVRKVERIAGSFGEVRCAARASGRWDLSLPGSALGQINWRNLTLSNALEREDIETGALDRRIMALLALITQEHRITITALRSDHDKYTAGGSVSNHYYGRAMDIAVVDGVSCTDTAPSAPCGQLGHALARLPRPLHPTELIYCFDLDGPGPAFAAADHCNHVHAGYDG